MNLESQTDKRHRLLVWDEEDEAPAGDWTIVLWNSFGKAGNASVVSLPRLVEEHSDTLRSRYLARIYELGEIRINGKRLVDHLELRPGFSYWWMTLLVEKSYGKSTRLHDLLKCLALEDLASESATRRITLVSSDQIVAATLRRWCKNAGMRFEWKPSRKPTARLNPGRLRLSLPHPARAVFTLAQYLWRRWPLRKYKSSNDSPVAEITFVDYLVHLDRSALMSGRFASNFWTELLRVLNQARARVNWLHLYVQHEAVPSTDKAGELIARFNHNGGGHQFHAMLDGAGFSLAVAAVRDYVILAWQSLRLLEIVRHFRPAGSNLDLWPLFKQDWLNSMRGATAAWNCLVLNLIEKSLSRLPRQQLGVYLQENQGWEMAFIHAWRAAGHGYLIGVAHGTVRYWDLRYFYDSRSYVRSGKNDLPLPDTVALNGPASMTTYRMGGYPEGKMVEVEALRYLYLLDQPKLKLTGDHTGPSAGLRVLVCGDILPLVTQQMMLWLEKSAKELAANTRYTVKPHPSCAITAGDYPALTLEMTNSPLCELFADCDVVFTSNITSAAADAYCAGLPVVQVLNSDSFNMSPLRGLEGVVYVTNPAELADALGIAKCRQREERQPYFFLDKTLPRWQKLLGVVPRIGGSVG